MNTVNRRVIFSSSNDQPTALAANLLIKGALRDLVCLVNTQLQLLNRYHSGTLRFHLDSPQAPASGTDPRTRKTKSSRGGGESDDRYLRWHLLPAPADPGPAVSRAITSARRGAFYANWLDSPSLSGAARHTSRERQRRDASSPNHTVARCSACTHRVPPTDTQTQIYALHSSTDERTEIQKQTERRAKSSTR